MTKLAFVCVGNAGRSQMATALAERERDERGLDVDVVTGGVDPADSVHDEVVEAMREIDVDISDREPRRITPEDIEDVDHVVTMGCSVEQFRPDGWHGESSVWELSSSDTRDQRDELAGRVEQFFDELENEGRV
ncbi:low molecular weight phosphatase family protein [Halobacterium wangiae]|uniref:arsenate-mycothiol transferase ArsC n=1 Tax=Halobacterium wangiae TaxID=2902623 RepID=UPI001E650E62|nr:low molecular weight phosphatase family protein [Halobacterium wangiae]